jgi:3-oxoacyl-[acyl-carrier-protein] synthase II
MRRAVFTAMGVLTPVGCDPMSYHRALIAGTSGVRRIRAFDPSHLPCQIAGEVDAFDAKTFIPSSMKETRKSLRVMARAIQMGLSAAQQAMTDGGPAKGTIDPFRFGIEFGCIMLATEIEDLAAAGKLTTDGSTLHLDHAKWGTDGYKAIPPLWLLKYLPNMPACHVSITYDAQGPNNTITTTDAASLLALGEAYRLLQRDAADFFLVGGCDSKINPLSQSRHSLFDPLCTTHNDSPDTAAKPYDANRDGWVFGEGAAVFGLEDLTFAQARGAKISAELCGFASGFDRGKKGPTFAQVIRNALKDARISPADIDHVNAAAGGSAELDAWEARAIGDVFGTETPVFAPRGHLGNTGTASGLIELAASILALRTGELPATRNHTATAADCPIRVTAGNPTPVTKPYALKVTHTDRGHCVAAVVKKWEG